MALDLILLETNNSTGVGPLFGLRPRVSKALSLAIVFDSSAFATLYTSPIEVSSDEENDGKSNSQLVRAELNAVAIVDRSLRGVGQLRGGVSPAGVPGRARGTCGPRVRLLPRPVFGSRGRLRAARPSPQLRPSAHGDLGTAGRQVDGLAVDGAVNGEPEDVLSPRLVRGVHPG